MTGIRHKRLAMIKYFSIADESSKLLQLDGDPSRHRCSQHKTRNKMVIQASAKALEMLNWSTEA
jgi:hypothetical protein